MTSSAVSVLGASRARATILALVVDFYGVPLRALFDRTRTTTVCKVRRIAWWLEYTLTGAPSLEIAKRWRYDDATIMRGIHMVEASAELMAQASRIAVELEVMVARSSEAA